MHTYIMKNEFGLLKIGLSSDVHKRVKTIESASGVKTTLEYYVEGNYEKHVHDSLSHYRNKGEWFNVKLKLAIDTLNDSKKKLDFENEERVKDIIKPSKYTPSDNETEKLIGVPRAHLSGCELDSVKSYMLNKLINHAGTISYLSRMLDVSVSTINGWVLRKAISKKGAIIVSFNDNLNRTFTPLLLRPDLTLSDIDKYTKQVKTQIDIDVNK